MKYILVGLTFIYKQDDCIPYCAVNSLHFKQNRFIYQTNNAALSVDPQCHSLNYNDFVLSSRMALSSPMRGTTFAHALFESDFVTARSRLYETAYSHFCPYSLVCSLCRCRHASLSLRAALLS